MSLIAKDTGSGEGSVAIPASAHIATCVRVLDLGTQILPNFDDRSKTDEKHRLILTWELPAVRVKDKDGRDMPALISAEYTCSLHDSSTLYKHLKSWRGAAFSPEERAGFSLAKLLGAPCTVQIENNKNGYPKVTSVMSLVAGTPKPKIEHELFAYEIEEGTGGNFAKIPKWQQEKIMKSIEMLRKPQEQEAYKAADEQGLAEAAESYSDPTSPNYIPPTDLPF